MKIVITIPAFNEEKTIGNVIDEIKKTMNLKGYNYKILVIDDGSKDRTAEIAKAKGAVVYSHVVNRGLANAFKTELSKSIELGADVVVHIDADGQYLASEIPKLIGEIENGYDLVLGSRFKGKIEHMPLTKRIGNKIFSKVISQIVKMKISDAQTGFRAFTKEVARKIEVISSYTYTQEQIIKAAQQNFKIKEVPVYFAKRRGKSRLMKSPFEFAIKAIINLLRIYRDYKPLKFFGFFGWSFFGIGFLIGLWLVHLFFKFGDIQGHTPSALLSILFMSIGVQILLFGFLADMVRK